MKSELVLKYQKGEAYGFAVVDHDQYGIGDRINLFVCLFMYEYLYGKKAEV